MSSNGEFSVWWPVVAKFKTCHNIDTASSLFANKYRVKENNIKMKPERQNTTQLL
jgi:hypothetical protein